MPGIVEAIPADEPAVFLEGAERRLSQPGRACHVRGAPEALWGGDEACVGREHDRGRVHGDVGEDALALPGDLLEDRQRIVRGGPGRNREKKMFAVTRKEEPVRLRVRVSVRSLMVLSSAQSDVRSK